MQTVMTVGTVLDWLDRWAPLATAEEWDNVGLLVGCADAPVTRILTALDVTPTVVEQAAAMGIELIVSHHPVIFRPLKRLDGGEAPFLLARHGIAAMAMHTNLDKAPGGVNDALAARLELRDVHVAEDGLCRIGKLEAECSPAAFAGRVGQLLGVPLGGIQWADGGRPVSTVAVCGGAGGECLAALPSKVDAFVTGELHYHEWPPRCAMTLVAAGHYHTEAVITQVLAQRLAEAFPSLTVVAADEGCPYTPLA